MWLTCLPCLAFLPRYQLLLRHAQQLQFSTCFCCSFHGILIISQKRHMYSLFCLCLSTMLLTHSVERIGKQNMIIQEFDWTRHKSAIIIHTVPEYWSGRTMRGLTGRAGRESHTRSTRLTDTGTRTCPVHSVASEYFLYTSGHEWMEGSIEEERRGLNPLRTFYLLLFTSNRLELTVRGERWVKSNPGPRFQFLYIVYKYVFIITHTHTFSLY